MKKQILLIATIWAATVSSYAQFSFVHMSDLHISNIPFQNSDTNAHYFRSAIKEFAGLNPKPHFVVVSGDVSNVGNEAPDGMYPTITRYLFPPTLTNPGIGDYFIDSARTVPIYFTPGNHEYWVALSQQPVSNDTLKYYTKYITPDRDYAITTELAVMVVLRSGHDASPSGVPNPDDIEGSGLSDDQITYLRDILSQNSTKRKIIVFHHPAVNAIGTNSDGTPFLGHVSDTADNSFINNRTRFLNICDSNHVDLVLNGHEHQNVAANRKGDTIGENWPYGTRYVQTAAGFNRSYRIITVEPDFVSVSKPKRSNSTPFGVNELSNSFHLSVFPNPASDKITIGCNQKATMDILKIEGQIIRTINNAGMQTTIDLSDLSKGVYIIKAKTDAGIAIMKFIKQ
ncbi:MAG: metallophosphoesterase [Bacteroidota bacterium]